MKYKKNPHDMCDIINQNDTVSAGDDYDNEWKIIHEKKFSMLKYTKYIQNIDYLIV